MRIRLIRFLLSQRIIKMTHFEMMNGKEKSLKVQFHCKNNKIKQTNKQQQQVKNGRTPSIYCVTKCQIDVFVYYIFFERVFLEQRQKTMKNNNFENKFNSFLCCLHATCIDIAQNI